MSPFLCVCLWGGRDVVGARFFDTSSSSCNHANKVVIEKRHSTALTKPVDKYEVWWQAPATLRMCSAGTRGAAFTPLSEGYIRSLTGTAQKTLSLRGASFQHPTRRTEWCTARTTWIFETGIRRPHKLTENRWNYPGTMYILKDNDGRREAVVGTSRRCRRRGRARRPLLMRSF